jgi:hypothetical protein
MPLMVICFAPSAVLMVLMVPDAAIPGLANRKVARQDVRVVVGELYLPTMGVTLLKRWRRLRCWLWWPRRLSYRFPLRWKSVVQRHCCRCG